MLLRKKKIQRLRFQNQRLSYQRHYIQTFWSLILYKEIEMKFIGLATLGALALNSANAEVISVSQSSQSASLGNLRPQEISNSQIVSTLKNIDSNSNDKSGQFLEQLLRNMQLSRVQKAIQASQYQNSMKALKNSWDSYLNPLYQDPYYKSIIQQMKLRDSLGGLKMITDQISPFI